jgi:hypothetical protein
MAARLACAMQHGKGVRTRRWQANFIDDLPHN